MAKMTMHNFFKELNYTLDEQTAEYIGNLSEVNLKLLIKRVYENSDLVSNELNRQVKLTKFKNIQELVQSLNRDETDRFVRWMSENIFGASQVIQEELEKILVKS
jgi:hypothetical protein